MEVAERDAWRGGVGGGREKVLTDTKALRNRKSEIARKMLSPKPSLMPLGQWPLKGKRSPAEPECFWNQFFLELSPGIVLVAVSLSQMCGNWRPAPGLGCD